MVLPFTFVAKSLVFGVVAGASGALAFAGVNSLMSSCRNRRTRARYDRPYIYSDPPPSQADQAEVNRNAALVAVVPTPQPAHATLVAIGDGRLVMSPKKSSAAPSTSGTQRAPDRRGNTEVRFISSTLNTTVNNGRAEFHFSGVIAVRVKSTNTGMKLYLNQNILIEPPVGVEVTLQDDGAVQFGTLLAKYVHVNHATHLSVSRRSHVTARACKEVDAYNFSKVAVTGATSVTAHDYCQVTCRQCDTVIAQDHSYVEATGCGVVTVRNEAQATVTQCDRVTGEDMAVIVHQNCKRVLLRDGAQEAGSITRKQVRNAVMWLVRR